MVTGGRRTPTASRSRASWYPGSCDEIRPVVRLRVHPDGFSSAYPEHERELGVDIHDFAVIEEPREELVRLSSGDELHLESASAHQQMAIPEDHIRGHLLGRL